MSEATTLMTEGDTTPTADTQTAAPVAAAPAVADATQATSSETEGQQAAPDTTADAAPEGAPESYEFKQADGQAFDASVITAYADVAKELNLSQDSAQKVIDKVAPVLQARQAEQIQAAHAAWIEGAKADKEFGGDKLTENLSVAKKAMDKFGTPELKTLLNQSGLGNHPEIIRAFYRAGKSISEDTFVGGRAAQQGGKSLADRLYTS
jgi:hypothetical protein